MKKIIAFLTVLLVLSAGLFANPVSETPFQTDKPKYVASTSWVAAIGELSGLDDISTIAPANLKHPPEYEITADDLAEVVRADLFLYAGYEVMMETIKTAAGLDEAKTIRVKTQNRLSVLGPIVEKISSMAGTQTVASERYGAYEKMIEEAREEIKSRGLDKIPCYVNSNQTPLAEDLGLNVAGIFGPAPLTSNQIADAAGKKYKLIIDNVHAIVTEPLREVCPDSVILIWRNFPEYIGNNALYSVVEENIGMLLSSGL
ncbi:MAG: ABC transporter substrate-binding protein [Sphaerochaeta sp.]